MGEQLCINSLTISFGGTNILTIFKMDSAQFKVRGNEMIDYIINYMETVEERRVTPDVKPGYLQHLLPEAAPQDPEPWENVMQDIEDKIMLGMTHWQHPRFHAYFSSGNSYPSILGDMLSDAIGCIGFSWAAGPSCTELETIVLDWMGQMLGLPSSFLVSGVDSRGGGVIQSSASECILDALLAARANAVKDLKQVYGPDVEETTILSKLVAYCSKEAHSCVEKASMIGFVKIRILEPDSNHQLTGETLQEAMEADIEKGLHPFFVTAVLGSTGMCAFDRVDEIGPVCQAKQAWLHVDGSYAGNSFICPEMRHLMRGIEYANSFNINPNKWMLVSFDCSCMWVKDQVEFTQGMVVDPLYLQHDNQSKAIDYRHWGIPLSRRFRALKLWFVIRSYGVSGLQAYIRNHCKLAKVFEQLVRQDDRFKVVNKVQVGLVCFKLVGNNDLNKKLLSMINNSGRLHMVPTYMKDEYVIRMAVCAENATEDDMQAAWDITREMADLLLEDSILDKTDTVLDKITLEDSFKNNILVDKNEEKLH